MSIIDAIIKANKEGRKVEWPSTLTCIRCNEPVSEDVISRDDLCEHCYDDLHTPWPAREAYIEAAQPVNPKG